VPFLPIHPSPGSSPDPTRFATDVARLTATTPPGPHRVIFLGSSTLTLWPNLDQDLGGIGAINHGFGGSQLSDCLHYASALAFAYEPDAIVLYGGDNDMANVKSAETIIDDYERFADLTFAACPDARLYWVSIKPSIARWTYFSEQTRVNDHVIAASRHDHRRAVLDIRPAMLDTDGQPRAELFLEDGLHLNTLAYAGWTKIIRPRLRADLLDQ